MVDKSKNNELLEAAAEDNNVDDEGELLPPKEIPKFLKDEEHRLPLLTSYKYNMFVHEDTPILADRAFIFKAKKIFEAKLEKLCRERAKDEMDRKKNGIKKDSDKDETRRKELFDIYVQLGHVNLLAMDFPKSMFAYQHAYKYDQAKFRSNPPALYGLGLVYFHFKAHSACIEAFNHFLYCQSGIEVAKEVHVRLGIVHKTIGDFDKSRKHFCCALDDLHKTPLFTDSEIQFHIAHCYDASGDLKKAFEEYQKLKNDKIVQEDKRLLANVYRALGWVCFRSETQNSAQKSAKLAEAEQYLQQAQNIDAQNSRSYYYLGRCYSETPERAHSAFQSYRASIDKNEHDADTWCSIGVLYKIQNQDLDALQAFVCAVQINPTHSTAWTNLGKLYESHCFYRDANYCYKKAVINNSSHPEPLKRRIQILEKAIKDHPQLFLKPLPLNYKPTQNNLLYPLEQAWSLGIPAELLPHQKDLAKLHRYVYRLGSPFAKMSELAASFSNRHPFGELNATQLEIMKVLQLNKDQLESTERSLLQHLEQRFRNSDKRHHHQQQLQAHETTVSNEAATNSTKDLLDDPMMKPFPFLPTSSSSSNNNSNNNDLNNLMNQAFKDDEDDEDSSISNYLENSNSNNQNQNQNQQHSEMGQQQQNEDIAAAVAAPNANILVSARISPPIKSGDLPSNFSLLSQLYVPITINSSEVMGKIQQRLTNPEIYSQVFDEQCPPPRPEVIQLKKRPQIDKLGLKTPLIKVEKPSEAHSIELQNFCYKSPIALIRGLTSALKMDLSLFSTKSLIETQPNYEVEVRTQYRMPGDINVDQLGQPTWHCISTRSSTNIGRYGVYQAESFRHSLKEETERLRAAGTGSKYAIAAAKAQAEGTPLGTIATTAPVASLLSLSSSSAPGSKESTPSTSSATANNNNNANNSNGDGGGGGDAPPPTKRRRTTGGNQASVNASAAKLAAAANLCGPDDLPTGHMPMKIVKFGTNVDLSDETKFPGQLKELNKMPAFCRNSATCNLLSHLGHAVFGMNTVQMYMKVPGCRTPGHLENNCFASININIGPGECEWFGVDYEYWPVVDKMCKDRKIDLMKGSWWPNFEDLIKARVPVYRFTQKAGDLVWVGGGCVHWVQSIGWCNNVAWNVGPMTSEQIEMSLYAYEWNKLTNYRSLVPMQHLCWQLAQNVRFSNQKMYNVVKGVLIRSLAFCRMIYDYVETRTKNPIKYQQRIKGEASHYCHNCDVEVFNMLFVKEHHNKFRVFCVHCAKKTEFEEYVVLQQTNFDELCDIFDRFQLHPAKTPLLC